MASYHGWPSLWREASDHIRENQEEVTLEIDVPGMSTEDIAVSAKKNHLFVEGKASVGRSREVKRHYLIPDYVDKSQISAVLKAGVLTVTLPLRTEPGPTRIPVTVGT